MRGITDCYAVLELEDEAATKQVQTLFDVLYALGLTITVEPKEGGGQSLNADFDVPTRGTAPTMGAVTRARR